MFNIVERRHWYFLISALIILPGIVAMVIAGAQFGAPVRLGIDFTGGTLWEIRFEKAVEPGSVRQDRQLCRLQGRVPGGGPLPGYNFRR